MNDEEIQKARELIEAEHLQREQACMAELEELLKRHNCHLDVSVQSIGPMMFRAGIVVRAL